MKEVEILKSLVEEGKNNAIDVVKRRLKQPLSVAEEVLYQALVKQGFVVIPNFFSTAQCEQIKEWVEEVLQTNKKIWQDTLQSDNRIYFADSASESVRNFYHDTRIINVLSAYEETAAHEGFTLANKLVYKENNAGSGGGWHRDFVKRKQTKALLYLSAVTGKEGPFQFIEGTHKFKNIVQFQKEFGFKYNQFRFSNDEIEQVTKKYPQLLHTIVGEPGTLILVDTRGIHRGKPIDQGVRYALTNYYWFGGSIPGHIKKLNPF